MARLSVISPMLSKKPAANAYAGYGNPEPLSQYVSVSFFIMNLCMMMSFDKKTQIHLLRLVSESVLHA